jgi:hypothetical protein
MKRSERSRAARDRTMARLEKAADKLKRRQEKRRGPAQAQDDRPQEPPPGASARSK